MNLQLKKEISLEKIKHIFRTDHQIALYQHSGLTPLYYSEIKGFGEMNGLNVINLKNNLVRKALENTSYKYFSNVFEGPCLIAYTSNENHINKLCSFQNKFTKLSPIAAVIGGSLISASQFELVSKLSSVHDFKSSITSILFENLHNISNLAVLSVLQLSVKTKDI